MQGPAEKAPVEAGTLLGQLKQGLRQVFLESAQSAEAKAKADSESDSKNGGLIEEGLLELANEGSASEADLQAKQFTEEVSLLDKSSDADVAASLAGGTLEGAKPLLDTRPAIANLCSILEQILQHGLRPSISEGSYGLIGGVMAGWRRAPPQQLPPSAWRFLEAVVGPASAQSRGDTSTTGKSTEAASSSSVVEGTRTAAPTGGTGGSSISLSSGGKSAEKLCSYPPLVGGLAQVRAFAGTSTASARLQALLRLGLGCRCLGQWLAEALLSPAAQGVSGKGGLLAQWYDETAFVRSHDSVEALVAAMMALGALHFEGLETRFVEGPGMVTEGCGEGLGLFKESGGAESEVQADGPGGATEGGVSERTGTGARVSESGQSAGQTSVSASGKALISVRYDDCFQSCSTRPASSHLRCPPKICINEGPSLFPAKFAPKKHERGF